VVASLRAARPSSAFASPNVWPGPAEQRLCFAERLARAHQRHDALFGIIAAQAELDRAVSQGENAGQARPALNDIGTAGRREHPALFYQRAKALGRHAPEDSQPRHKALDQPLVEDCIRCALRRHGVLLPRRYCGAAAFRR
jgi:hypothetical protein